MKQIIFFFLTLILSAKIGFAQDSLKPIPHATTLQNDFPGMTDKTSSEHYLKKSKKTKTGAWILLGAGSALTIGGIIAYNDYKNRAYGWEELPNAFADDAAANFAMICGGAMVLASVPLFIVAHNQKKKGMSASVSFNFQPYQELHQAMLATKYMPSLSFRINL